MCYPFFSSWCACFVYGGISDVSAQKPLGWDVVWAKAHKACCEKSDMLYNHRLIMTEVNKHSSQKRERKSAEGAETKMKTLP